MLTDVHETTNVSGTGGSTDTIMEYYSQLTLPGTRYKDTKTVLKN